MERREVGEKERGRFSPPWLDSVAAKNRSSVRTLCPRYAQNFRNRLTSPRAHQIRIEVALARIREEEEEEAEKEERKPATYAYTRARRAFK